MWSRIQTVFAVIVLTCFIWIFAERQVTSSTEIPLEIGLDTQLAESHPELLVEFLDENDNPSQGIAIELTVGGTTGRIQDLLDRRLTAQSPVVNLEVLGIEESLPREVEIFEIDVVRELFDERLSLEERDTFLQVTQSSPERLRVRVTPLEQRLIPVRVYDWSETRRITKAESNPTHVTAWLIRGQVVAEAKVTLNLDQQGQAGEGFISTNATVVAARREQVYPVEVRLLEWETGTVSLPRLGVVFPPAMASQYRVVIESDPQIQEPIEFSGSSLAMSEFQNNRYHLLLEIYPEDRNRIGQPIIRTLKYALPDVEDPLEIIDRERRLARFQLEPVGPMDQLLNP